MLGACDAQAVSRRVTVLDFLCLLQTVLQEVARKLHKNWSVHYLVKCHCEMNPAELVWNYSKRHKRTGTAASTKLLDGTVVRLRELLAEVVTLITPTLIQHWTQHCERFMEGYLQAIQRRTCSKL